jgi:hypothetical protein
VPSRARVDLLRSTLAASEPLPNLRDKRLRQRVDVDVSLMPASFVRILASVIGEKTDVCTWRVEFMEPLAEMADPPAKSLRRVG